MTKLSAAIIASNEEKHIARTLQSLKNVVDEMVVVIDEKSKDRTEEIAKNFDAVVFKNEFESYGKQKQFAVLKTTHNLVLNIDADEAIDDRLINELQQIRMSSSADAYTVGIKNFYCGKWMFFGGINSTKRLRIFKKDRGNWNDAAVHEKIVMQPNANIQHLNGNILHIAYESKVEHIEKLKKYAALNAKQLSSKPKIVLLFKMLFSPLSKFISSYILKLGLLEGKQGLQFAILMSYETFLKYKKSLQKNGLN
jgi:glycosyltransferase involved in cell wall biosynthesis